MAMNDVAANPIQAAAYLRAQSLQANPHTQVSISFGERTDSAALREAWGAVSAAHPGLRTLLSRTPGGEVVAAVSETPTTLWAEIDWTGADPKEIPDRWAALQSGDSLEGFGPKTSLRISEIRLPGGGSHFLMTAPEYLLDEASVTRVLLDWLLALDRPLAPEEPAGQTQGSSAAWAGIIGKAEAPLTLRPQVGSSEWVSATKKLNREEAAGLLAACKDRPPAILLELLWALTLRRLGATGNVLLRRVDARRSLHEADYFENWLPVALDWAAKDWPDVEGARTVLENAHISPAAALQAGGARFPVSDIPAAFSWCGPEINDVIRTALPRWINFDARLSRATASLFCLEARPDFSFCLRGPLGSPGVAAEILERFLGLACALPAIDGKPIAQIPLLLPAEARALKEVSQGPAGGELPATALEAFREIVARWPDAIAVKDGDYELTFRELDSLSDRLAQHLAHVSLAGGWHVALFLSPSSWIAIALIGSWKAGNPCLALDPSAPPAWIESLLSSHDAGVVLCDAASAPLLDASTRRRIILDQDWDALETGELPQPALAASSPAAILPGHPEGSPPLVRALTHEMLVASSREAARLLDFGPGNSFLAHSSAGGGAFFDEWLIPLLAGGTILVPDDSLLDPVDSPATHLRLTAPEWANQAARWSRLDEKPDRPLKVVAVELGQATSQALEIWKDHSGEGVAVVTFFSPASLCGLGLAGLSSSSDGLFLSAGRPSAGCEASVRDPDGYELPPGFPGELWIKFPGWKSHGAPKGRRGLSAEISAWRSSDGSIFLESVGAPGQPISPQALSLLTARSALDVFEGEHLWTLSREKFPGTIAVEEWPLTRGGWVDAALLPKPSVTARAVSSPPSSSGPATTSPEMQEPPAPWNPISLLQSEGTGAPLVLVPPLSGLPDTYHDLVSALGSQRRIFGLTARGAVRPDASHPSIEASAAAWIDALLEEDPSLSFALCGFGFGAIAALEMARQLAAARRPVPGIILLGAPAPQTEASTGWLASMKNVFLRINPPDRVEPFAPMGEPARSHETAWSRYRLAPCDVPARIVLPSDFPADAGAAWVDILPSANIEFVKCTWAEMLAFPAVKRLATIISESR